MRVYTCNIWDFIGDVDAICVTTNGFITDRGFAVMGRGIALEASERYFGLKKTLGRLLKQNGNHVSVLINDCGTDILSFPVKRDFFDFSIHSDFPGTVRNLRHSNTVPGWALKAELSLIERSATELVNIADYKEYKSILLPKPGCNNGELKWCDVEKILDNILDDRFFIVSK